MRYLILMLAIWLFWGCGGGSGSVKESAKLTPVYVTIFSHNEDSWGPVVQTRAKYQQWRDDLVERMKIIHKYGAKLSWQSDIAILKGILDYEAMADCNSTNGQHLLHFMTKVLKFSAEPHAHRTNYADLMHMFDMMDVNASPVIGGIKMFECGNTLYDTLDFVNWKSVLKIEDDGYIYGELFDQKKFRPEIISLPSFGGHWFDGDVSGAWHPGNGSQYYDDEPSESLIAIGQGYPADTLNIGPFHESGAMVFASNAAYIKELIQQIRNTPELQGKFMTASISTRDVKILNVEGQIVDTHVGIETMLQELQPYVDSGEVVYVTYPEAAKIWKEEYYEESMRYSFENSQFFEPMRNEVRGECGF